MQREKVGRERGKVGAGKEIQGEKGEDRVEEGGSECREKARV